MPRLLWSEGVWSRTYPAAQTCQRTNSCSLSYL